MKTSVTLLAMVAIVSLGAGCNLIGGNNAKMQDSVSSKSTVQNGGYASQVAWGHHLVLISGCNDCHTPKKMTPMGPILDTTLLLSGHPSQIPLPDIDKKEIETKGLVVTQDMTSWIGPWGISYSANITPDNQTGIGSWTEDQFIRCIRTGKWMGVKNGRVILPPMPWQGMSASMSDAELKAIFAYLKSIKPIRNIVPAPAPNTFMHKS